MNTRQAQETAAALGIIPWQRRELVNTDAPRIHILIAVPPEDKTHPLLQTMLASFHLPAENLHVTTLSNTLNDDIAALQPEHLLILSETTDVHTNIPTTRTHSLTQLMQHPALKRETYAVLKSLGLYV